jgi:hypothetical protein
LRAVTLHWKTPCRPPPARGPRKHHHHRFRVTDRHPVHQLQNCNSLVMAVAAMAAMAVIRVLKALAAFRCAGSHLINPGSCTRAGWCQLRRLQSGFERGSRLMWKVQATRHSAHLPAVPAATTEVEWQRQRQSWSGSQRSERSGLETRLRSKYALHLHLFRGSRLLQQLHQSWNGASGGDVSLDFKTTRRFLIGRILGHVFQSLCRHPMHHVRQVGQVG